MAGTSLSAKIIDSQRHPLDTGNPPSYSSIEIHSSTGICPFFILYTTMAGTVQQFTCFLLLVFLHNHQISPAGDLFGKNSLPLQKRVSPGVHPLNILSELLSFKEELQFFHSAFWLAADGSIKFLLGVHLGEGLFWPKHQGVTAARPQCFLDKL